MIAAAVRGGNARIPSTDETNNVQTVRGMRINDIPLVRKLRIVVAKFRLPMVKETMNKAMPRIHRVWPHPEPGRAPGSADRGGYDVHPPAAAPPSTKKEASMIKHAGTIVQ